VRGYARPSCGAPSGRNQFHLSPHPGRWPGLGYAAPAGLGL